jgi:DNA-binding Xre family transcriptional regulator
VGKSGIWGARLAAGDYKSIEPQTAKRLCHVLGVKMTDLLASMGYELDA